MFLTASAALIAGLLIAPVSTGATVGPAYKGSTAPGSYTSVGGCASGRIVKGVGFDFRTGAGSGGLTSGKAASCSTAVGPVTSAAYLQSFEDVLIDLKLPAGTTNVTPRVVVNSTTIGTLTLPGACRSSRIHTHEHTALGSFQEWYNASGFEGYCSSYTYAEGGVELLLLDPSTGAYVPITASTGCEYVIYYGSGDGCLTDFGNGSYVSKTIEWDYRSSQAYTDGNGTGWTYYNFTCRSCNSSTSTPWSNFSSPATTVVSPSFGPHHLVRSHLYVLEVDVYCEAEPFSYGWPKAVATASCNVANAGNGFSVPSITVL